MGEPLMGIKFSMISLGVWAMLCVGPVLVDGSLVTFIKVFPHFLTVNFGIEHFGLSSLKYFPPILPIDY